MSTSSRLHRVTQDYRARLKAHEAQAERQLEQAYAHVLKAIQPALNNLYDEMTAKMEAGEDIPLLWLYERLRLENIILLITHHVDQFGSLALMNTRQLQHLAVELGQSGAMDLLNATVPNGVNWTFGTPSTAAIANMIGVTQAGSPLADLFEGFGREAADLAKKALIQGITLGDNPRKTARDVQQALGVSRARALTLSRDTMNNAYRNANLETYRANDDVCSGWVWSAALGIACAVCTAMNGTEHTLEETLDSHPNCRCAPLPKTKSWEDILSPLGIDAGDISDTSIEIQSGSDWFDNQPASAQRDILGNAKYAAYQAGDLALSDLVYHGHDPDWGGYRQEKSLKDAIGAKQANKYYAKAGK